MTWLALFVIPIFLAYFHSVIRRTGLLTADSIFVYLQLLMLLGTLPLLEPQFYEADGIHGYVLAYTFITYMITSAIIQLSWTRQSLTGDRPVLVYKPGGTFGIGLVIGVLIVLLYFRAVGYSAFYDGVSGLITGQKQDIATLRLNSYGGARYLFPGYVNQVKNAALPAMAVLWIIYGTRAGKRRPIRSLIIGAIAIFGLIGTSQRSAFVIFVLILGVYAYLAGGRRISSRMVGSFFLLFVPMMTLATAALARSSSGENSGLLGSINQFVQRIFTANQTSSVVGWRYIYERGPVGTGQEWLKSLQGLLPGSTGSTLANDIFAVLYGGTRGTSPPSIWGSIYYNFGMVGISLAPILLAIVVTYITRAGVRPRPRNTMELMGVAGVFVIVGSWVISGPLYLLNGGLVVFILLWLIGRKRTQRQEEFSGTEAPPNVRPVYADTKAGTD
jgi:hypothetical protein